MERMIAGALEGMELSIVNGVGSLSKRWTGDLSFEKDEKAIIVQGKPATRTFTFYYFFFCDLED